ncbi:glycosyltransferase family 2 protein [Haloarchaeobius sp. DFWS5]|uniref:glycosyltransferase family 2 protein n=1 Tax=Haloarchaeobius sp. DFWS5 TaxID=3446114 RepID=UPI003EB6EDC2
MYGDSSVAVVVPAYNEENHVADVLQDIPAFVDRVYAIDDQSSDGTWDEILRVADEEADEQTVTDGGTASEGYPTADDTDHPTIPSPDLDGVETPTDGRIVPIKHEVNRGAGGALKTGFERAMEDEMDVTVTLDADGQMDPGLMDGFVEPIAEGEADYTKGNRLARAEHRAKMPTFRLVGNWMLSVLTKVASGYWHVMDPQNGYTAISLDALEAIDLDAVGNDHEYTNDMLVQLNVEEMRVVDVPMEAKYGDEESTISLTGFVPMTSMTLLRGFFRRLYERYVARNFHPLSLFYGIGVVAIVAGVIRKLLSDDDDTSLLVALQGVFFVLVGMALDHYENATNGGDDR